MDIYEARKLKFKAWNTKTKLMMRLKSIDCVKGELYSKDHILLQFTGHSDMNEAEIYEQDVVLREGHKYVVCWNVERGWVYRLLQDAPAMHDLRKHEAEKMSRLCSYFELSG